MESAHFTSSPLIYKQLIFRDLLPGIELGAEIVHIPVDNTFEAERKTCYLLEKGVVAIFGPR